MKSKASFPVALDPPEGPVVVIDESFVDQAVSASRKSPRGRIILPLHKDHKAPLHRMLNVMQPGSYVQPHRHLYPPKAEAILVLRGTICVAIFDDEGGVLSKMELSAQSSAFGVDIEPGVYHTFFALEPDTVLFEVKPGPYERSSDKDFAPWAPKEGSGGEDRYLAGLAES